MTERNLFWSQYKALEKEFLKTTRYITFDDNHTNVYSEQFIDILMRTWVEIETISKKLFLENGGSPKTDGSTLYFDGDCLKFLNDNWHLNKKRISVDYINFYFEKEENTSFQPLKNCEKTGDRSSRWKRAYQAVKHDRSKNHSQASLINCLKSLGALYLLNVYYKGFELNNISKSEKDKIDYHLGSEIFVASTDEHIGTDDKIEDIEAVVSIRTNEQQQKRMRSFITEANINTGKRIVEELLKTIGNKRLSDDLESEVKGALKGIDSNKIAIEETHKTPIFNEFSNLKLDVRLVKR